MISILVTTYNRRELLERCLASILRQTYTDFEIVIIDDASTDRTHEVIPGDKRVRYWRNDKNQGSQYGDRIHIRRFVKDLAQGEYFIYLCDDDYWPNVDLLENQMQYFQKQAGLSMVIGGQRNIFHNEDGTTEEKTFTDTFPKEIMTSQEYLEHFSKTPIECNIIIGATLYNRDIFLQSGALVSIEGTKWQAGYEMLLAPGCYGYVGYINKPCVVTEIKSGNASFRGTQTGHYLDSMKSVYSAFKQPLMQGGIRKEFLKDIKQLVIDNISKAYLSNADIIEKEGKLTMCSEENISEPVTQEVVREAMRLYNMM